MGAEHVLFDLDNGVAVITLSKPERLNAVDPDMRAEIGKCVDKVAEDESVRVLVITGEGKHFSFGASVEEHKPGNVDDMLPKFHAFIGDVINCKITTLAAVTGLCLGGGFELVLACDLVFAEEGAKFGVPEIQLAVFPPVASALLPFKCGSTLASEIILTGGQFTAEMLQEGLTLG